jgi:hypothetical protein
VTGEHPLDNLADVATRNQNTVNGQPYDFIRGVAKQLAAKLAAKDYLPFTIQNNNTLCQMIDAALETVIQLLVQLSQSINLMEGIPVVNGHGQRAQGDPDQGWLQLGEGAGIGKDKLGGTAGQDVHKHILPTCFLSRVCPHTAANIRDVRPDDRKRAAALPIQHVGPQLEWCTERELIGGQ